MKKHIKLLIVLIFIIMGSGCRDDYTIYLPNNYIIFCWSEIMVEIYHVDEYNFKELDIPAKVVEVAYNDDYIVAKQMGLKNKYPECDYCDAPMLDNTIIYYWIIDSNQRINYEPYKDINDYEEKLKEFNIESLELKKISYYDKLKDKGY